MSRVVSARVPDALAVRLDAEAARTGVTASDIVRVAIERALPPQPTLAFGPVDSTGPAVGITTVSGAYGSYTFNAGHAA